MKKKKFAPIRWARDIIKDHPDPIKEPQYLEAASIMVGRYVGADEITRSYAIAQLMENVTVYCDMTNDKRFRYMIQRGVDMGIKNPATEEMIYEAQY